MSDDNDEVWNPEDDKMQKEYMKKAIEAMDRLSRPQAVTHVAPVHSCGFSIQIRAIDNGFLLSYTKAVQSGTGWFPNGTTELFFDFGTLGSAMDAIKVAIEDLRRLKDNSAMGNFVLGA